MSIGPSTTTAPYLIASAPNVRLTSLLTAGDTLPDGSKFAGLPDGIAAFDNGDGTITVLVVHQFSSSTGIVRDHGSTGSFIDRLIIDKATLQVTFADDLIKSIMRWSDSTDIHLAKTTRISKLSTADFAEPTAYFNAASGLGTDVRILLTGEENGSEGRVFATIVSGANAGTAWELPYLGNMTFETAIANPFAQDRTILAMTDDTTGGQVYFYIGAKQATGSEIVKAGLMNGDLYGLRVEGFINEANATPVVGAFTLQEIGPGGDVSNMSGSQIEAESDLEGVTGFLRPEDAAWDPANPNVLYFVTTATSTGNSRLYKATFTDITQPELGGTIEALLVGNEGHRMLDNIEISGGKLIFQEDPGDRALIARVWEYDIASDSLTLLATMDPALFTPGAAGFITQYEESSGVLDVTHLLGDFDTRAYLVDAQLHKASGDPATYQGGQLMLMLIDTYEPPVTQKLTFNTVVDTYLQQARPTTVRSSSTTLQIDGDAGLAYQTLLAFTGLFGEGAGQIPVGATITSAVLTLNTVNSTGTGAGIYRMTTDWTGASTWGSLGDGVQVGTDTSATADLVVSSIGSGVRSLDVTASLIAWLNGAATAADANAANKGWAFIANGNDGWDFSSSESGSGPVLTVNYTMANGASVATLDASRTLAATSLESVDAKVSDGPAFPHWNKHHGWLPPGLADHHSDLLF